MSEIRQPRVTKTKPLADDKEYVTETAEMEVEPLSLAEEIAEEAALGGDDTHDRYEQIKHGDIHIAELQRMSMPQLIEQARSENLTELTGIKKQDLIFKILKERVKLNGLMFGEGDAGSPAGRLRLFAQPRLPLSLLPG